MYEVSIIVPVYNVQNLLSKCVESLIHQTIFQRLEIILVDDGSNDACGDLCDNYSRQYENIQTFHKINGGVSSARNYGLSHAKGEYIAFVDADDSVEPFYYETLLQAAKQKKAELVVGDYNIVYLDGKKHRYRSDNVQTHTWDSNAALVAFLKGENIGVNLFDKLFYREKIGQLRFDENIRIGEDLYFIFQYLTTVDVVYGDFTPGYNYLQREGSAMNSTFSKKYFDVIEVSERILTWIKEKKPDLVDYAEAMYVHSVYKTLERGYKGKTSNQYQKEMSVLSNRLRSFPIIKAWKGLSRRQFLGFLLMRMSPFLYMQICRAMRI